MKEKAIRKYNHVVVLTPMVYAFNLSGCRLLVFAYIHGFCRDESSSCYSSLTHISETIGYARRTVAESINALIKDGYIYKIGTATIDGQQVNGYRTYFYELMDRYDAGEEIVPAKLRTRRSQKKEGGAQSALPLRTTPGSAQNHTEVVHKTAEGSAQNRAQDNTMINLNNNLSNSAPAREAEEREFFIIFFLRNAADPAAETRKFVGWYQSRNWTSSDGVEYKTTKQRCGLAYAWNLKGPGRLQKSEMTDRFYGFLKDLYVYAKALGGIEPWKIIDTHGGYYEMGQYRIGWRCLPEVRQWVQTNLDSVREIKNKYFGTQMNVTYV